jgi:hypothetical protein
MAKEDTYEVLRDGLTLHKDVRPLKNPLTGEPVGYQRGMGRVYLRGEKVAASDVASIYRDALENKDDPLHETMKSRLKKSGDEPTEDLARRLGLPFDGYDEMETKDIVAVMRSMPSATVQNIKRYESQQDDPRTEIVNYNVGFGEHPDDRQLAELEVPDPAEGKAAAEITSRNVPESGPVEHGEGVTGTGEPKVPFGAKKAAAAKSADNKSRSGRRSRSGSDS